MKIGKPRRIIDVEPIEAPETEPVREPAEPAKEPVPV